MKIEAFHDRIVIKKIDLEFKSKGGLILGEVEKEREHAFGKVLAVGPGKQVDGLGIIPTNTKTGDIIIFNERLPQRINVAGEFLFVLRESEAYGRLVLEEGEAVEKDYQSEGAEYEASNNVRQLK